MSLTYRCPPSVVEAVRQLVDTVLPTLNPNVFLHNDIMPSKHTHSYNDVTLDFVKTHASYVGDVPSYLGYKTDLEAPSLGYYESLTVYVYDPSPDRGEVNREAVKRALWCLLARPVSTGMISIYVTMDAAGRVGYEIRN